MTSPVFVSRNSPIRTQCMHKGMTLQCTCMGSVDMSHGVMTCSMDRSKMHVQRRHSVRKQVCTIIIREHYCFFHMKNSVCIIACNVSVHMCASVCAFVYQCVCLSVSVCMCVCMCVCM